MNMDKQWKIVFVTNLLAAIAAAGFAYLNFKMGRYLFVSWNIVLICVNGTIARWSFKNIWRRKK